MSLEADLARLVKSLSSKYGSHLGPTLERLCRKLLSLYSRGLVKSNHSAMELVVAAHLAAAGYEVDVEHKVSDGLVCDVFASNGGETLIVEIETGFVPPANSLDPVRYRAAREVSKVARYSQFADLFALAAPPYHALYVPEVLVKPPRERSVGELVRLKELLDAYYRYPPITIEQLASAKLDAVYVVIVDTLEVIEYPADRYRAIVSKLTFNGALP